MASGRLSLCFGLAIVAVFAAAAAILTIIVQRSIERVDAEALTDQRSIIHNVLTLKAERFDAVIEVFSEFAPLSTDFGKVQAFLDAEGAEMKNEHDVDAILIYDSAGRLAAQFVGDNASPSLIRASAVTKFVERQIAALAEPYSGGPRRVGRAYLFAFGKVFSASITAIRPKSVADGSKVPPASTLYMLWLSDLTQAESDTLARNFAFEQLSLHGNYTRSHVPVEAVHLLRDDTGKLVGWFSWTPETNGQAILDEIRQWGPLVGLLTLALLGVIAAQWAFSMSALSQKQAEATEALRSSTAKSQFLANMSHELRTPLNAIIGFAEMIKVELFGPICNPKYRDYVSIIHDSGKHLLCIIDQVLNLAKIESKTRTLASVPIPLDALIDSVAAMARPGADARHLVLTADSRTGLCVQGDETALRQVLINLVGNAIKYTDVGGVHIQVKSAPLGSATIAVQDTGIGIPPEHLVRLCTPFHQVHDALVQTRGGVGLGLSITKALIEAMGGRLDIASKVGQGTAASIRIPLHKSEDQLAA